MNTPDIDKIRELIIKVEALAQRGIDGEKDAAKAKLEILLKKYGIALKEIQSKNKTEREFSLKNITDCADILLHVVGTVDPKAEVWICSSTRKSSVWLTPEQFIEVSEKFRYFWGLYVKQKEMFLHAFLIKNDLTFPGDCSKSMTNQQYDELIKMETAIEKGNFIPENRLLESRKN